ncbi:MAG: hypothetical protein H0V88_09750 [Pyrinomonadaceae bacterium]|nr:hypothetical protein [Pyrinomonadaceae bacterium]
MSNFTAETQRARRGHRESFCVSLLVIVALACQTLATNLPIASPAAVGMSAERWRELTQR